ncbi:NAD-dependent epimerase/dehydratase family protein [Neomoorella thermoacetica]|uniref:NAD-dependent epimerase/dehydratase family protein n=1 Tax=Neomoorella thermoacetica TaxID=1525 RepID=UPI0008FB5612|nr:NAD(P)-dependent oxidoreductase [Moorella thermoacetica]APC08794.1 UDP-glucose 4-epimerase [Moorella thermoacetica]
MEILITGGSGDVGRYLVWDLAGRGHRVRVLDRALPNGYSLPVSQETLFKGQLEDKELVVRAVKGVEAVIHLAWSFSDDPLEVFGGDLIGHINLLTAAARAGVKHFIYASTATVYGRAAGHPVVEEHPCLVGEARKPLYALGKFAAEELCRQYCREQGLPVTIFRFWWAFGDEIGGRHLRNLIRVALNGEVLRVPVAAGGTFVSMADLAAACRLVLAGEGACGQVYNLGSLYLTWEEIASKIIELTGSAGKLQLVPQDEWTGPAFLNEVWDLSWEKAARELGYRPTLTVDECRSALTRALLRCVDKVRAEREKS